MKKWIGLVVFSIVACSHGPAPGAALSGATAPRQAVAAFLDAVKAQDLQAMSTVWGDERGPARDRFERTTLEQRLVIMQRCYEHDRYRIVDESVASGSKRIVSVALTRGSRSKTTNFDVVRGPSSRYFVNVSDAEFTAMLRDFCPVRR